jgi:hypothetical protein
MSISAMPPPNYTTSDGREVYVDQSGQQHDPNACQSATDARESALGDFANSVRDFVKRDGSARDIVNDGVDLWNAVNKADEECNKGVMINDVFGSGS